MTEISIIMKFIIAGIFLIMFAICAFLGWRLFWVKEKFKLLQADRDELLEERAKQSNKLRLKGIEMDEADREKFILSTLEKKMILGALNMPEYKNATENPDMKHDIILPVLYRKTYRELVEKIKESIER